ncbi:isochorismatase family protein [Pyrenochaeta sp. DS3sAY3a]|nr:isochorismatase family protein [Pyrenochaeta sp. DS3sAY3a]
MTSSNSPPLKALIGSPSNFWTYTTSTGFDLTHPATLSGPLTSSNRTINTNKTKITIDPSKSALIIIDMQNFFLSEAFGRKKGAGHAACEQLLKHAIPAARKAGIRIVWLNWGLTEQDLEDMPPAVKRAFGFLGRPADEEAEIGDEYEGGINLNKWGERNHERGYRGLGADGGKVTLDDGSEVDVGGLLMRDMWNTALYPPLDSVFASGAQLPRDPDVWIHKNRMSGMWGGKTPCDEFLEKEGIKTLFFAGVNTDQCVGSTLVDAFNKGYDCILLQDGCGTTSPKAAQECWEYNATGTMGFCTSCEEFARGAGLGDD